MSYIHQHSLRTPLVEILEWESIVFFSNPIKSDFFYLYLCISTAFDFNIVHFIEMFKNQLMAGDNVVPRHKNSLRLFNKHQESDLNPERQKYKIDNTTTETNRYDRGIICNL